jgi:hypothetical protein
VAVIFQIFGEMRGLSSAQDQAAGEHVVQRLLSFREAGKDVNEREDRTENHFWEIASRRSREGDALAIQVRDVELQDSFARRGLPRRTLKQRVIKQPYDND